MKQLIVLIATIVLGVAIASLVLGFRTTATNIATSANGSINSVFSGAALTN